ncbi:hypothetical protein CVD25_13980 [Bacillus canaveralius]|uniref:YneQ n=1 Tax=Bacillus canaveralius TaxID=1403243 RepID=A0A2N5GLF9_9BACI|nr:MULTISPECIES: hypothetical protein [Bacillus]PLR82456.1 hypothetical protein CU635_11645 [Bacillus canaveralius]PLR85712.1 hypothetical protein CVD23_08460 [Bacillus sp. V33-4]PLR95627.1 hypothetical protein CVD25_13980 [Bacillus canaveralius]RSK52850.1 hypothetical protein EJA13_10280 [Bacillus canaveralius]
MAFGINRQELQDWKRKISAGEIAFITHYWLDERFPGCNTVTKVGCSNIEKLAEWGAKYDLKSEWIHNRKDYPHFDLIGSRQVEILKTEGLFEHIW